MSILGWAEKEGAMPLTEAKWWGNVLTGKIPFNHILQSHNDIHADATQELGGGWMQQHPDATAAAIFGAIAGGGALAGGAGASGAGAGAAGGGATGAAGSTFADYGVTADGLGNFGGLGGFGSAGGQFGPMAGADGVSQGGLFNLGNMTPMQQAQIMQQGMGSMSKIMQRRPPIQSQPVDTSMPDNGLTPAQPAWSWSYGG